MSAARTRLKRPAAGERAAAAPVATPVVAAGEVCIAGAVGATKVVVLAGALMMPVEADGTGAVPVLRGTDGGGIAGVITLVPTLMMVVGAQTGQGTVTRVDEKTVVVGNCEVGLIVGGVTTEGTTGTTVVVLPGAGGIATVVGRTTVVVLPGGGGITMVVGGTTVVVGTTTVLAGQVVVTIVLVIVCVLSETVLNVLPDEVNV